MSFPCKRESNFLTMEWIPTFSPRGAYGSGTDNQIMILSGS